MKEKLPYYMNRIMRIAIERILLFIALAILFSFIVKTILYETGHEYIYLWGIALLLTIFLIGIYSGFRAYFRFYFISNNYRNNQKKCLDLLKIYIPKGEDTLAHDRLSKHALVVYTLLKHQI